MLMSRHGHAAQRGMSIVELMVGVAVGLVVVGAAALLSSRNIVSARGLLSEVRVNQDLRAVADLVTRDLRRAAYWGNAIQGVQTTATSTVAQANPYATVATPDGSSITYSFTRDATEDNALGANEQFGFRLQDGRVEMQTADGTWQPVTDPNAVTVTAFTITPTTTTLALGHLCPTLCAPGAPNCPTVTLRRYELLLRGQSARDSAVVRELRSMVRVRNDRFAGACPA